MVIEFASKERLSVKDIMRKYRPNQIRCEMLLGKIDIILMEYFPESKGSFQYIYNSKIVKDIGRGAFSYIQSAVVSINFEDTLVAVKTLTSPLDGMYSYTQLSEARILSKLSKNHKNIMKMFGISLKKSGGKKFLQIYMEYCEESLSNLVLKRKKIKTKSCGNCKTLADRKDAWSFVTGIMEGLCSALNHVHSSGFVHRDLKLDNILVKGDHSVRLADFGLSKSEEDITGTIAGTPLYMAPEVMKGELYGSEADIYSLGMVLYELWYYRPVFTRPLLSNPSEYAPIFHTLKELEDNVSKGCRPDCKIPVEPPFELKAVMEICWDANKEKRPKAAEVYELISKVKL
ncbi:serine/threonine-protein kinase Nek7-like [Mytilus edulis]|uniref:serine/threonine-protein kinase Nek7-like n=1 Tax=Mytilus edulis TaxID=6550 RepID=UPI0039F0083D